MIVVLYKKGGKIKWDTQIRYYKKEFMDWTNGVWTFMGESRKRVRHPAPFPIELPRRCIKLFTFVDDTVLDPFMGSGSAPISCVLTNRRGIGVDIDRNCCEIAKRRLVNEAKVNQLELDIAEV